MRGCVEVADRGVQRVLPTRPRVGMRFDELAVAMSQLQNQTQTTISVRDNMIEQVIVSQFNRLLDARVFGQATIRLIERTAHPPGPGRSR